MPPDNPFVGKAGARPEIWSYGHRNPQGMALNPWSGELWESEHGPRGDEVNLIKPGLNYGWPLATYGIDYSGQPIPEARGQTLPGMESPLYWWPKSPAISGMAFYDAPRFPAWRHSLFIGALAERNLIRLTLDGDKVVAQERLLGERGKRIRTCGSDRTAMYVLTDESPGELLRIAPAGDEAMKTYELIGSAGCGSAIVEMALALANVPYTLEDVPYLKPGPQRDRLLRLNPLGQVPTLVTPDGEVMTESAAMILHLHDGAAGGAVARPARARALPEPADPVGRGHLSYLHLWRQSAAMDHGRRAADLLRERVHTRRAELWQELERQAGAPHMLGERFSALDLYVAVMTRWRPGPAWFESVCPALTAVAREAGRNPAVARALRRNFPPPTE